MFRLRDLKNGLYQIHKQNGPAFEGTPRSIFTKATQLGVEQKALIDAANELEKRNHDYADFTSSGKFVSTQKNRK